MDSDDRKFLIKNRVKFVEKLEPNLLCDYYVEEGLFNLETSENILHPFKCRRAQARFLLDILVCRGPNAFGIFIKGLRRYQPDLMEYLGLGENNFA
jgi:hypothetical protein